MEAVAEDAYGGGPESFGDIPRRRLERQTIADLPRHGRDLVGQAPKLSTPFEPRECQVSPAE